MAPSNQQRVADGWLSTILSAGLSACMARNPDGAVDEGGTEIRVPRNPGNTVPVQANCRPNPRSDAPRRPERGRVHSRAPGGARVMSPPSNPQFAVICFDTSSPGDTGITMGHEATNSVPQLIDFWNQRIRTQTQRIRRESGEPLSPLSGIPLSGIPLSGIPLSGIPRGSGGSGGILPDIDDLFEVAGQYNDGVTLPIVLVRSLGERHGSSRSTTAAGNSSDQSGTDEQHGPSRDGMHLPHSVASRATLGQVEGSAALGQVEGSAINLLLPQAPESAVTLGRSVSSSLDPVRALANFLIIIGLGTISLVMAAYMVVGLLNGAVWLWDGFLGWVS